MDPTVVAAWIAAAVSALTLVGTLVAQYLGYRATTREAEKTAQEQRRQLDRTLGEQRSRTLNERFATAAEQLGSDKPPEVRLAGVYAMAGLADDWLESRQTCVDVLCAYLRMPYEPDPGQDAPTALRLAFQAAREVRHTVIRVITAHLKDGAMVTWRGLNFDFRGVVFDGGDFSLAWFSGGTVSFRGACFPHGEVRFNGALFCGAIVDFSAAEFSGGTVDFHYARFSDGEVDFNRAKFAAGEVFFVSVRFSGSGVYFHDAEFSGAEVDFSFSRFSAGEVRFRLVNFSGGRVEFRLARFSGSDVKFDEAKFSGAEVEFSEVKDWSCPPEFPWTDTPPQGIRLPTRSHLPKA